MTGSQKRYIVRETLVGIILNIVVSAIFVWLMFHGLPRIGLWGMEGLAFDLVPTTFMITLMTTIALTFITRGRMRAGVVAPMRSIGPALHGFPPLRGLILGLLFTIALVPPIIGVLAFLWRRDWSYGEVMGFKIVYGASLGAVVTPVVLRLALADGEGRTAFPPAGSTA